MMISSLVRGPRVATVVLDDTLPCDTDEALKHRALRAAGETTHTLAESRLSRNDDGSAVVTLDRIAR